MSGLAALLPAFLLLAAIVAVSLIIVVMLTVGLGLVPVVVALTAVAELFSARRHRPPKAHGPGADDDIGQDSRDPEPRPEAQRPARDPQARPAKRS